MSTCHRPLHLLLSKCWLCKHNCIRPCNRLWSTWKLHNQKRCHCRRGIDIEIFSALSYRPFLMLWSQCDENTMTCIRIIPIFQGVNSDNMMIKLHHQTTACNCRSISCTTATQAIRYEVSPIKIVATKLINESYL
jgi:hypothetical protein